MFTSFVIAQQFSGRLLLSQIDSFSLLWVRLGLEGQDGLSKWKNNAKSGVALPLVRGIAATVLWSPMVNRSDAEGRHIEHEVSQLSIRFQSSTSKNM